MKTLYERLEAYGRSDAYGFHMPGHKRNPEIARRTGVNLPYEIDITEITGFDDLHHAEGIIKEAEEEAARLYQSEESHFLINGSTAGILSAILGTTRRGDTILVARNCHKSVYHAIELNGLHPVYLYPGYASSEQMNTEVSVEDVEAALMEQKEIRAVVIVSPTYDGVVSDIEAIAAAVHAKGIPLIVDEAHGAHFGFHPYFPNRALSLGADLVINSLHKTLPSLTQTAIIHMNGEIVDREKVRRYLHMLQSSSPSYVLMASIDACIFLMKNDGRELFARYVVWLEETREKLKSLKCLKLIETEHYDRSKILISVADTELTSHELSRRLREEYQLEMEMTAGKYILAMTSVGDTKEGLDRLAMALLEIDGTLIAEMANETDAAITGADSDTDANIGADANTGASTDTDADADTIRKLPRAQIVCNVEAARELSGTFLSWQQAVGHVALEYAYLYPPGCPLTVPGERVSQEVADMLQWYYEQGFDIEGLKRKREIEVWIDG